MALITPTVVIDGQTGKITYPFTGVATTDNVTGVVIRTKMCKGPSMLPNALNITNIPDGAITQYTLGASPIPDPIVSYAVRPAATFVYSATGQATITLYEGTDFTIGTAAGATPKQINFSTGLTGTNKAATLNYTYYDVVVANLVYDTNVYPSNCLGTMTQGSGTSIILWNQGILAQSPKFIATTGTVNAVIEALITSA